MENIGLSFIVPVYKVEAYLHKCVDSLLSQDYADYEIILVDDGSPDGCPQICDDYAAAHDNIRVIHRENGGLSAARNTGIKAARGTYICFVDSDDYWESNALGGLMEQVEREKLDVLRFDYQNVRAADSHESRVESQELVYEVFQPNKYPHQVDKQIGIVDGETYLNIRMGYECYAVMYIIKRSLIYNDEMSRKFNDEPKVLNEPHLQCSMSRDKSLNDEKLKQNEPRALSDACLFTERIHFEDVDWLPRMMLRAKRVSSTITVVYNYLIRQGSITQVQKDREKIKKNIDDRLLIIDKYRQYLEQYPDCKWLRNMQSEMASGVLTTIAREFYAERKEYILRLRSMSVFPLSIADQGKTYKRRAVLTNLLGADLYIRLMHRV